MAYYVYMLASRPRGTLYIGVSGDLALIERANPTWRDLYDGVAA